MTEVCQEETDADVEAILEETFNEMEKLFNRKIAFDGFDFLLDDLLDEVFNYVEMKKNKYQQKHGFYPNYEFDQRPLRQATQSFQEYAEVKYQGYYSEFGEENAEQLVYAEQVKNLQKLIEEALVAQGIVLKNTQNFVQRFVQKQPLTGKTTVDFLEMLQRIIDFESNYQTVELSEDEIRLTLEKQEVLV